jgi:hypothetical protein
MQPFINLFTDWKDFFKQKLTATGLFHLGEHSNDRKIEVEIYASSTPGFKTTIEIGYESQFSLVFLRILSPFTPGLNERQKHSYFHQNDFYPHSAKDEKGLEFDNFNLRGMVEYLSHGLKGIETVYLRNGKPVKSTLKSDSFPRTDDALTFYFEKTVSRFTENKKLTEEESYDQAIEIDLHEIYPGTNRS